MDEFTKLNNLKVTKVDLVDEGANPAADVLIFKNKEGEPEMGDSVTVTEDNLFDRLAKRLAEVIGGKQKEDIQKAAVDTDNRGAIREEIWKANIALQDCISSTLSAKITPEDRRDSMVENVEQFSAFMKSAIEDWSKGDTINVVAKSMPAMDEDFVENMRKGIEVIKSFSGDNDVMPTEKERVKPVNFNIDETKLSAEEVEYLNDLANKAKPDTDTETDADVEKGKDTDDVFKSMQKEIDLLKSKLAEKEKDDMVSVAKKYEILGENADELAEKLTVLKAKDEDLYNSTIEMYDRQVATIEKSGLFHEIGKMGRGGSSSMSEVEKHAQTLMDEDATLTQSAAIAKAFERNPELLSEYEQDRKGGK